MARERAVAEPIQRRLKLPTSVQRACSAAGLHDAAVQLLVMADIEALWRSRGAGDETDAVVETLVEHAEGAASPRALRQMRAIAG
jgi:hypothetical protein